MKGYIGHIEQETLANDNFRRVIYTSAHGQLVLMSLLPNEEIGREVHENVDQFFRIEYGEALVTIDNEECKVADGDVVIVPAGSYHNVVNTSSEKKLKLYTLYMPPHHKDGTVHKTKAEAEADEEDHL